MHRLDAEIDLQDDLALTRAQAFPFLTRGSGHHMGIVKTNASDIPRRSPHHAAILELRARITADLKGMNCFAHPAFDALSDDFDAFTADLFADQRGQRGLSVWAEQAEEDVFILKDNGRGSMDLVAGNTCFPSRWNPMERAGQTLFELHDPIPEMGKLPKMIHAFFQRLSPGQVFFRTNWSLTDDPAWFQPRTVSRIEDSLAAGSTVEESIFYRTEKQHVLRLSETCWVFLVNVRQIPLAQVFRDDELRETVTAAIAGWTPAIKEYKSWKRYGHHLSAVLTPSEG